MDVSIVIPVYNVEKYIGPCLESVIQQTYKGSIECIIVDDCGTDNSIDICKNIISKYTGTTINFVLYSHKCNRGLSAARNTGLKIATGDYIYFLDSDDTIVPECIELLITVSKKYPAAELIQGGGKTSKGEYLMDLDNKVLPDYTEDKDFIVQALFNINILPVSSWNKLVKRSFILEHSIFFIEGVIHEDMGWNFFLAKYLKKMSICKYNTYNYLIRDGSIMNSHRQELSTLSCIKMANIFLDNLDDLLKKRQLSYIFRMLEAHYVFSISKEKEDEIKMILLRLIDIFSFREKILLNTFLLLPKYILKRKFIYTFYYKAFL